MSILDSKAMTMEERLARVSELVRQFKENEDFYMSKDFVESEVRSKFIDPLLEYLKWDVKNKKGARPDKRGTASIDEELLEMIERWRVLLAEDIALHNEEMSEEELTSCVQKIIDRVLFLRICEDKEIEPSKQLQKLIEKKRKQGEGRDRIGTTDASNSSIADASNLITRVSNSKDISTVPLSNVSIYDTLKVLFARSETRFNSGLFKNDEALNALKIQDKTLGTIIAELYYPFCEYEFSVIPVAILGSIYERFLGRIIRFKRKTKNGHSVEIIEKPEVQKAGGVYYTPSYIVDYIVKETIGKQIEGCKNLEEVAQLKVCDPACGSGSFLVGAYQYLLDWHLDYYYKEERRENSEKKGLIYKDASTQEWKLGIEEKRRILLTHIFGVDIDAQAVEVTKLSLFLKLLENEGSALNKHGQASLFKTSELKKILPSMHENIKCGNSLIGSDYYDDAGEDLFTLEEQKRVNAFDWHLQFSNIFKSGGFDCVIGNPPYVLSQPSTTKEEMLRYYKKYEVASYKIDLFHLFFEKGISIAHSKGMLGFITPNTYLTNKYMKPLRKYIVSHCDIAKLVIHGKVFSNVSVDVSTIILNKIKSKKHSITVEKETLQKSFSFYNRVKQDNWEIDDEFIFNINKKKTIKLTETVKLGSICKTYFGIQAFDRTSSISFDKKDDNYLPIIDGEDVFRYEYATAKKFFHYKKENIKSGGDWNVYNRERIVVRQIGKTPIVGLCEAGILASNTLYSLWSTNTDVSLYYILSILNSSLMKRIWETTYSDNKVLFPKIKGYQLKDLPIKLLSSGEQEPLVKLANAIIDTQKQLKVTKFDSDKKFLTQRIDLLDKKIDAIVCDLYGVSEEEI